jgi:hypothetical protein
MDEQTNLYLTTQNTDKRQTFTTSEGFEPAIPAGDRPQTHALDRAATVISILLRWVHQNMLAAVSPLCQLLTLAIRRARRVSLGSNNPPSGRHDISSEVR